MPLCKALNKQDWLTLRTDSIMHLRTANPITFTATVQFRQSRTTLRVRGGQGRAAGQVASPRDMQPTLTNMWTTPASKPTRNWGPA